MCNFYSAWKRAEREEKMSEESEELLVRRVDSLEHSVIELQNLLDELFKRIDLAQKETSDRWDKQVEMGLAGVACSELSSRSLQSIAETLKNATATPADRTLDRLRQAIAQSQKEEEAKRASEEGKVTT